MSTLAVNTITPHTGNTVSTTQNFTISGSTIVGDAIGDVITFNAATASVPNGLRFDTSTLVIDASNNRIGINTTAPAYDLDVAGNGRFTGNLIVSGTLDAHIKDFIVQANTMIFGDDAADTITINSATASCPNNLNFDSNTLVIDAANNRVGVGTPTPAYGLHVHSGSSAAASYVSFTNSDTGVATADGAYVGIDSNADLRLFNQESAKAVEIGTQSTTRVYVAASGNVGIGTSTPANLLDVEGGVAIGAEFSGTSTAPTDGLIVSGNVGIGLTGPQGLFHVAGEAATSIFQRSNGSAYGANIYVQKSRGTVSSASNVSANDTIGNIYFSPYYGDFDNNAASISVKVENGLGTNKTPGSLIFSTSPSGSNVVSERMRINSSGNVGIGTSSPSSLLELESASGDLNFEMDNNAANSANFQIQNLAGSNRVDLIMNALSADTTLTMKGQKIGILDTDPSYTLDVNGDAQITTNLTIGGILSLADGSAGAPSLTNTGDTNCGLFFSGSDTLAFTAGGTAQVTFADGVIAPVTNDDVDLGTTSLRFKNIYTMDLHLANDRGDWTVIEEEDYLSLRNNKNGKLFKILMQEISEE